MFNDAEMKKYYNQTYGLEEFIHYKITSIVHCEVEISQQKGIFTYIGVDE